MLSLDQIAVAVSKTVDNARELVEEAEILLNHQRFARAYTLAHLAIEEMAKPAFLIDAAMQVLNGESIGWSDLRSMRNHIRKIEAGILWSYFDDFIKGELRAGDRLKESAGRVSLYNSMKNWSLYAGCMDGEFVQPSEVISEDTARSLVRIARHRIDGLVEMNFLHSQKTAKRLRRAHAVSESIPDGQAAPDFLDRESTRAFVLNRVAVYEERLKCADQDDGERKRKIAEIAETESVSCLLRLLRDKDWQVREAAAWALERIGKEAIPGLLTALKDDDDGVRETAAWSLGYIGDPSAIQGLIEALADKKLGVCLAVIRSLRRFDTPEANDAIESFHTGLKASMPSRVLFDSED